VNDSLDVTVSLDELPGRILLPLLAAIKGTGSLSRAAQEAGVSYRYAWSLLNKLEKTLNQQLVVRKTGGCAGGGTELTGSGLRLLEYLLTLRQETRLRLAALLGEAAENRREGQLVLASTMEPVITGLMDVLEQTYLLETGIIVRHIAAGSGQALGLAKAGRADLALTHAPELEETFIAEGWGTRRQPVMVNDCGRFAKNCGKRHYFYQPRRPVRNEPAGAPAVETGGNRPGSPGVVQGFQDYPRELWSIAAGKRIAGLYSGGPGQLPDLLWRLKPGALL
jgi:molybdate transport repressor ModE-like protein